MKKKTEKLNRFFFPGIPDQFYNPFSDQKQLYMKRALWVLFFFVSLTRGHAQERIEPNGKGINQGYLVPRNIFQKLIWLDKDGHYLWTATLNCVTRVDSVHKRLTYLQIRNDGHKDSTVVEWPGLKPVYTSSVTGNHVTVYDYQAGDRVRTLATVNGKTETDSTVSLSPSSFDSFLTDYLIGAIPLKRGFEGSFTVYSGAAVTVRIKDVFIDVLFAPDGKPVETYLVNVDFNGYKILYWIDRQTGEMLKCITPTPDGRIFMKTKI